MASILQNLIYKYLPQMFVMDGQGACYTDTKPITPPLVYEDLLSFVFGNRPSQYDEQRPIYIDAENPSRTLNASQFRKLVRMLIAGFKAKGLQKGDCVLVHLPNNILYSAIFYGVIGAEGIHMGTNPRSQPYELEHLIQQVEPTIIITSPDGVGTVRKAMKSRSLQICVLDDSAVSKISHHLASRPPTPNGTFTQTDGFERDLFNFSSLFNQGQSDWIQFDDQQLAESTPAAMFATSGTGGLPKAAILSHHTIVTHHLTIHYPVPYDVSRLMSLPMFHLFSALWCHIFPIRYGEPLYVLPRFNLEQYVQCVYIYRITETYMVPAMVQALNQCSSLSLGEFLTSLRYVGVAGACIDAGSVQLFQDKLHTDAQVSQLWGMTEVGVVFQTRYGVRNEPGSIGTLLQNSDVKLVDSSGNLITLDGQEGELYVRGPGTLMRYKGVVDAVSKDEEGWFRTGDIMCSREGKFYITGRVKELIKVNGWQVPPAEIEAVLLQHPDISDAAVIGVPQRELQDNTTGAIMNESVRAFVVPRGGCANATLTADTVYRFARERLASYKAINGGVVFVNEIPRTASGKIQRFKLAQVNAYRDIVTSLFANRYQLNSAATALVQV
ncbi:hypothetical protein FQN50_009280 [Emmonsiellopsis sp. PD_5]|nr:hypothetical protein FQN50_009280 [Emmonsiellopsis sp. PD_5]